MKTDSKYGNVELSRTETQCVRSVCRLQSIVAIVNRSHTAIQIAFTGTHKENKSEFGRGRANDQDKLRRNADSFVWKFMRKILIMIRVASPKASIKHPTLKAYEAVRAQSHMCSYVSASAALLHVNVNAGQ